MREPDGSSGVLEMMVPEAIVPAQYFPARWWADAAGEARLMLAVLEDAIGCALNGGREARAARKWIGACDDAWVFGFENICNTLELDAQAIRSRLERMRQWVGRMPRRSAKRPRHLGVRREGGADDRLPRVARRAVA